MRKRELSILLTAILVGVLIIMQGKSFTSLDQVTNREARTDIFREIQILKNTNDNLNDEVKDLEDKLGKMSGQEAGLQGIASDIGKYKLASGQLPVSGPGISFIINGDVSAIWLTDSVNELFAAGAEAVSLNNIRITDQTSGFDTIPNGQIMLNSVILKSPYKIEAIGDKNTLADALSQPQGIIQRLKESVAAVTPELQQKDLIKMDKVI